MIESLLLAVMEITISTSFLILALLFISPILRKKYTARWQYIIWFLIATRLIIPINLNLSPATLKVSIPLNVVNSLSEENKLINNNLTKDNQTSSDFIPNTTTQDENTNLVNTNSSTAKSTDKPTNSQSLNSIFSNINTLNILSLLWILGAVLFLFYQFIGYYLFKKKLLRWSIPVTDENTLIIIKELCYSLKIKKSIKIMKCKKILSPMAIGLINPIILLPELKIPSDELSIILKHELIHIKRHDISYKLLLTLANSLHWFNPTIYIMVKEANKDLEFYCDEMVVKNMDINYKAKYSEAILSVMHSKTNYNSILSTNFNGGVKVMKKRFKNIFDNSKKRVGILSLTFIFALVLCGSSLVACQSSQTSSEETAKGFLKGYYEVDNPLLFKDLMTLFNEEMAKGVVSQSADGYSLVQMTEAGGKRYNDAVLKNVKPYINEDFGESLIANRAITRSPQSAYEYDYTLQITDIKLNPLTKYQTEEKIHYDYSLEVKLTYEQDGSSQTQTVTGRISLGKLDGKWLVLGIDEKTTVTPDDKYYNPTAMANLFPTEDTPITDQLENFSDSKALCDAYLQAMLDSNFTFIANNTANALKNTTLEELQKLWDTIKVESASITNSEERVNSKYPDMSKAYYEIKLNVSDPGQSEFKKGENTIYLYLFSSKKGDVIYWTVESFNNTAKPYELWWDTVYGG